MFQDTENSAGRVLTLAEYATELGNRGRRMIQTSGGTFWIGYDTGSMMRLPTFNTEAISASEVREVFWSSGTAVVSYLLPPDSRYRANASLYICTDNAYALDKLAPGVRRNVHRGLKELRIAPLYREQLLADGVQAFCDTRRRNGLSDGTAEVFWRRFAVRAGSPGHVFFGAWKDNQLAAFLSITEVSDWAEIEGCFSRDTSLRWRPNDTLFFYTLFHYLVDRHFRLVSYGLSSVQGISNRVGLHAFKTKLGFEAKPVYRVFEVHPVLRPLANPAVLWSVRTALSLFPLNPRLKKAEGMLSSILYIERRQAQ